MVPNGIASGGHQGTPGHASKKDDAGAITFQAGKVTLHLRPRSPGRNPATYLPIESSRGTQPAPKGVDARPVLHLEVEHPRRGDARQPGSSKPPPRTVIDVLQLHPRASPRTVPAAGGAAPAFVSITGAPADATNRPGRQQNGTHKGEILMRAGRPVPSIVPPCTDTSSARPYRAPVRHSSVTQLATNVISNPLAAANLITASATSAAQAELVKADAAALLAPVQQQPDVGIRTAKSGGAALLAELLGTRLSADPPASSTTATSLPDLKPRTSSSPGQVNLTLPRRQAQPPGSSGTGGGALLRESVALAWSLDLGRTLAGVALAELPDPEEEARRARRRHRKRVARIVVDHWKNFSRDGLRAVAARRHLRRRFLTAAWVAWQAETTCARSRLRLAAVHDMKRSFLVLGRCVQAWSATAKHRAQLRMLLERVSVGRLLRQARACLHTWRSRCYYAAEKQRRQLQAWFYYCFSTMTRALRRWLAWAASRRVKGRRAAWADVQHDGALGRKALAGWRRRVELRIWKLETEERVTLFRRRWVLRGAVRIWQGGAAACVVARRAAVARLSAAAARIVSQKAAAAFLEWQDYVAARRRRHQRERYGVAYMRRWRQLVVMWAWRQRVARSRHLQICERELRRVGRVVRLGLSWSRWWLAVEVLQGRRVAELRAAVLGRASWATWRAVVEHQAAKRELLRMARYRVKRVVTAAALAAWRTRAEHWRRKAACWCTAVAWHRRHALVALLRHWHKEACHLAAKGVALVAAQRHRRRKLLVRAVRSWRRYAWRQQAKLVALDQRPLRLLYGAVRGWLRHTRYKALKEMNRRRAVRNRYLTLLHAGLTAFHSSAARRRAKQRDWDDLARLHGLHVARTVLRAWRLDFLLVARAKQAVVRRADTQRRTVLLRRSMTGWLAEALRLTTKRMRRREAAGFAALRLLRWALRNWAAAPALQDARRRAKVARLAGLIGALSSAALRRVLAAWWEVYQDQIMKRFQNARARAALRRRVLRRVMIHWALYLTRRRAVSLLAARARGAWRGRTGVAVLAVLAAHSTARRAKRRRMVVASEHQRMRLLRRGIGAFVWYVGYRSEKARGYAAAQALYVRRLQRGGVAVWLEVGLERRQERIELLAMEQARKIAVQLARVERFARRWLSIVRTRRQERAAAAAFLLPDASKLGPSEIAAATNWHHAVGWIPLQPGFWPSNAPGKGSGAAGKGAGVAAVAAQRTATAVTAIGSVPSGYGALDRCSPERVYPNGLERVIGTVDTSPVAMSYGTVRHAWMPAGMQSDPRGTAMAQYAVAPAAGSTRSGAGWSTAGVSAEMGGLWASSAFGGTGSGGLRSSAPRRPLPRTPHVTAVSATVPSIATAPFASIPVASTASRAQQPSPVAPLPSTSSPLRTDGPSGYLEQGAATIPRETRPGDRVPLRSLNVAPAPGPAPTSALGYVGNSFRSEFDVEFNSCTRRAPANAAAGAGPGGRARPPPRCPDFLLQRRPATVSIVESSEGKLVRPSHDRPASSEVFGVRRHGDGDDGGGGGGFDRDGALEREVTAGGGHAAATFASSSTFASASSHFNGATTRMQLGVVPESGEGSREGGGSGVLLLAGRQQHAPASLFFANLPPARAVMNRDREIKSTSPASLLRLPAMVVAPGSLTGRSSAVSAVSTSAVMAVPASSRAGASERSLNGLEDAAGPRLLAAASHDSSHSRWSFPHMAFHTSQPQPSTTTTWRSFASDRVPRVTDGAVSEMAGAAEAAATSSPPSPSPSIGITIHNTGSRPPDIFRLPTRDEGSWAEEESPGSAFPSDYGHLSSTGDGRMWQPRGAVSMLGVQADVGSNLGELEGMLLYCKRLRGFLQQLEDDERHEKEAEEDEVPGECEGQGSVASAARRQQAAKVRLARQKQAAEVRSALVALRPAVEDAAVRLRQLRALAAGRG